VDAFRAVEAAQSHPEADPSKVIVAGGSQGSGIVVAVAGLAAGRLDGVIAALPDVLFLQAIDRLNTTTTVFGLLSLCCYRAKFRGHCRVVATQGRRVWLWAAVPDGSCL
jgi:cephalosporin-C deacetylase-like acetyl esterase